MGLAVPFSDLESVGDDFDSYEDFESTITFALQALREQGLYSILTTSKDGIRTAALQAHWPASEPSGDGWSVTFPKFQADVVPLFDAYSPQCYATGKETGASDLPKLPRHLLRRLQRR